MSRITSFASRPTYSHETSATTNSTTSDVVSVNFVLRLSRMLTIRFVLLQLVVQSLQADAEQFRRPRLILIRSYQRLQNQFALRSFDGGAHGKAQTRELEIIGNRRVPEFSR